MKDPAKKNTDALSAPEESTPKEPTTDQQAKPDTDMSAAQVKKPRQAKTTARKKDQAKVKITPPAPPSSPATTDFKALLATIEGHDLEPGKVDLAMLLQWHRTAEESRRASFARGYLLGRALNALKAKVEHGDKETWARSLGITPQMVNIYIRGYKAIQDAVILENRFSVPTDLSFTGWVGELNKGKQEKDNPEEPKKPTAKRTCKAATTALVKHGSLMLEADGVDVEGIGPDSDSRDNLREQAKKAAEDLVEAVTPAITGKIHGVDIHRMTSRMAVLVATLEALKKPVSALSIERQKRGLPEDIAEFGGTFTLGPEPSVELEQMTVNAHTLYGGVLALKNAIPKAGRRESPAKRYLMDIRSTESGGLIRILTGREGITGRVSLEGVGNPATATVSVDRDRLHNILRSVVGHKVQLAATKENLHIHDQRRYAKVPALYPSHEQLELLGAAFNGDRIGEFKAQALADTFHHLMQGIKDGVVWLEDGYLAAQNRALAVHGRNWSVLRMNRDLQLGSLNGTMDWVAARSLFRFFKEMKDKQVILSANESQLIVQVPGCVDLAVPAKLTANEPQGLVKLYDPSASRWWNIRSKDLKTSANFVLAGGIKGDDNLHLDVSSMDELKVLVKNAATGNFSTRDVNVKSSGIDPDALPVPDDVVNISMKGLLAASVGKREICLELIIQKNEEGYIRIVEGERLTALTLVAQARR